MSTPYGTSHTLCPECKQDAYPGLHGTACSRWNPDEAGIPLALRNQILPPPLEPCEWCNLHTPDYYGRTGRKPVGMPCDICGNDAPRGTYPMPGRYTGPMPAVGMEPPVAKHHVPPRAPQWRKAVA